MTRNFQQSDVGRRIKITGNVSRHGVRIGTCLIIDSIYPGDSTKAYVRELRSQQGHPDYIVGSMDITGITVSLRDLESERTSLLQKIDAIDAQIKDMKERGVDEDSAEDIEILQILNILRTQPDDNVKAVNIRKLLFNEV